jgi:sodium-dependent dicarboxylate transporter 2/3/5
MFLGLAYSASVGGLGTPIGTPPNIVYLQYAPDMGFVDWLAFGIPTVCILVPLIWFFLVFVVGKIPKHLPLGGKEIIHSELKKLGRMSREEWVVGSVFLGMALLWITRDIKLGLDPTTGEKLSVGWAKALGVAEYVHDGVVAVLGAIVLFAWPSKNRPGERILDWETARKIPWDVLLLFGGGLVLAKAFGTSGLDKEIVAVLEGLKDLPTPFLILAIALSVTFLTEVTSNTATATLMIPAFFALAASTGIPVEYLALPAVLSVSCAFMLPVATAPNAIVYGSGRVSIKDMMRVGAGLNIICAVVVTLLVWLVYT